MSMHAQAAAADGGNFGSLLREWRAHRRMSQLSLALEADISQRHVSFLETGRANPSRAAVARLADALAVPLRERNVLLSAAGFAAGYDETALTDGPGELFREAVEAMLAHQDPFPALVLDGRWNLVQANEAALRFFGQFVDLATVADDLRLPPTFQIARLCLHDDGLRPCITNWADVVESLLRRARLALAANPRDTELAEFVAEILAHPHAPEAWQAPERSAPPEPAVTLDLAKGGKRYRLFTMLAHFGNPRSVALQELAVELFYPADEETRAHLLALA